MCRLGGIVLSKKERTDEEYVKITEDLLMLLVNMEDAFGGDGNGISFHWDDGSVKYLKEHLDSNRMFRHFNTIVDYLKDGAIIVQMHARLSTGGSSENHDNLHPFEHGDIIGTHNGTIQDEILWNDLKAFNVLPYSEVDSEAIFASFNVYSPSMRPKLAQVVINDLMGIYALSVYTRQVPNMLTLIKQDNPLCFWENKEDDVVWYASTEDLFPRTLNIPTTKEMYYDKRKKKKFRQVMDVTTMEFSDMYMIRSSDKGVAIEYAMLDINDTWGYGSYGSYNSYSNASRGSLYGSYYEDTIDEPFHEDENVKVIDNDFVEVLVGTEWIIMSLEEYYEHIMQG